MSDYKKVFVGSGKEVFKDLVKVSIKKSDISKLPTFTSKKGDQYVNFDVSRKKETDQFGNTHSVSFSFKEGEEPSSSSDKEIKPSGDWDF